MADSLPLPKSVLLELHTLDIYAENIHLPLMSNKIQQCWNNEYLNIDKTVDQQMSLNKR